MTCCQTPGSSEELLGRVKKSLGKLSADKRFKTASDAVEKTLSEMTGAEIERFWRAYNTWKPEGRS